MWVVAFASRQTCIVYVQRHTYNVPLAVTSDYPYPDPGPHPEAEPNPDPNLTPTQTLILTLIPTRLQRSVDGTWWCRCASRPCRWRLSRW